MKFVSALRWVGSIPRVTFLAHQLKKIRTCSLGTLALTKIDKNGTRFLTKTSEDNTNLLPGNTCSEKTAKNGTSLQYEKTCSDKNQQRQYKRVA
jgi:hypothetical protein